MAALKVDIHFHIFFNKLIVVNLWILWTILYLNH
jgi:hypothetical protein